MRFIDLFKLSTRMFKARTSRTLLTVLGMSIGIAAIMFLVSLGEGLRTTLLERITTSDSLLTLDISEAKSGIVGLNREMVGRLEKMSGVEEVSPAFQITTQGHLDDLSADLVVFCSKPSFLKLGGFKADKGYLLKDEDPNGIVISSAVAQLFGKNVDELMGKEMTFTFFIPRAEDVSGNLQSNFELINDNNKFKVVGTIESEENIVYINSIALDGLKIEKYGQVKVKAKSTSEMNVIRDSVLEQGLLVSSLSETVDQANQIFSIVRIILMLFGTIALVVSAIGMFNTMTITLLERTEEIGIMKSIGASDGGIAIMFFMEAAIMGFLGGLAGVFIGWIGGRIFNLIINFIATSFGGEKVNLFNSPTWLVLGVIISSAIVGLLTGFVPARRASKTDPLDALRYK